MGRILKSTVLLLPLLIVSSILTSCSDDPTGATQDTGQGDVDPKGERDFFLGSTTVDGVTDGRIDVWAYNLTVRSDSSGNMVAFDVALINRSRTTIHPPVFFFITKIIPSGVNVLNSEIVYIREGPPGFDFSDDLGQDGKLEPGEQSALVTMQFGMNELTSFSIGFDITVGSSPNDADLSGIVYLDRDQNGERDYTEPGIPGVEVALDAKFPGDVVGPIVGVTQTDHEGRYGFAGLHPGIYEVQALGPGTPTTPNRMLVTLLGDSSGVKPIDGVDFGFFTPDSTTVDPVFGPVFVGPGSENGTRFEGSFRLPVLRGDDYILEVMPPMVLPPEAILTRVDVARVWLNGELIFEFVCDDSAGVACLPGARVGIPPQLLMGDPNHIQILVEGSEYAALMFAILRANGWPNS